MSHHNMINKTEEKVKVYLYDFRGKYTLFLLFLSHDLMIKIGSTFLYPLLFLFLSFILKAPQADCSRVLLECIIPINYRHLNLLQFSPTNCMSSF